MNEHEATAGNRVLVVRDDPVGRALGVLLTATEAVRVLRVPTKANSEALQLIHRARPETILVDLLPPGAAMPEPVPGLLLLAPPVTPTSIRTALRSTPPGQDGLAAGLRSFFRVRESIRGLLHDLANSLDRSSRPDTDEFRRELSRLAEILEDFAWIPEAAAVRGLLGASVECVRRTLARVGNTVFGSAESAAGVVPNHPPPGFETILAADDQGYPREWVATLEELGYGVEVVTTPADARMALHANPGAVFACDLGWGDDPTAGRQLLAVARKQPLCRLAVAVTAAPGPADTPEAEAVCAGPEAKTADGATRLHRVIWMRAARGD